MALSVYPGEWLCVLCVLAIASRFLRVAHGFTWVRESPACGAPFHPTGPRTPVSTGLLCPIVFRLSYSGSAVGGTIRGQLWTNLPSSLPVPGGSRESWHKVEALPLPPELRHAPHLSIRASSFGGNTFVPPPRSWGHDAEGRAGLLGSARSFVTCVLALQEGSFEYTARAILPPPSVTSAEGERLLWASVSGDNGRVSVGGDSQKRRHDGDSCSTHPPALDLTALSDEVSRSGSSATGTSVTSSSVLSPAFIAAFCRWFLRLHTEHLALSGALHDDKAFNPIDALGCYALAVRMPPVPLLRRSSVTCSSQKVLFLHL
jgi:hypothetical protein